MYRSKNTVQILCVLALMSCGREKPSTQNPFQEGVNLANPTMLPLIDGSCQEGISDFSSLDYSYWDGAEIQRDSFQQHWSSANGIQSQLVNRVLFGYQEIYSVKDRCRFMSNISDLLAPHCLLGSRITSQPKTLKICSKKSYPRESLESAALSTTGAFDKIQSYIDKLSTKLKLDPTTIMMVPDIQIDKGESGENLSLTDNAAWVLSKKFEGIPTYIVVYPPSEGYKSSGRSPFWEVPWIVSHEYGHHIFYSLLPENVRHEYGYLKDWRKNQSLHDSWFVAQAQASQSSQLLMTAANEAIADLFAHYVNKGNSDQITSLSCVFDQRDISTDFLNDGHPKSFLHEPNTLSQDFCNFVDFSDVHTLGSILSYFVDRYLELGAFDSEIEKGDKVFQLTDLFLKKISIGIESQETKSIIEYYVSATVEALSLFPGKPNQEQCQLIDAVFGDIFTSPQTMSEVVTEQCAIGPL